MEEKINLEAAKSDVNSEQAKDQCVMTPISAVKVPVQPTQIKGLKLLETQFSQVIRGQVEANSENEVDYNIIEEAKNGRVAINQQNGKWVYEPKEGFVGEEYFKISGKDLKTGLSSEIEINLVVMPVQSRYEP